MLTASYYLLATYFLTHLTERVHASHGDVLLVLELVRSQHRDGRA